MNTSYLLARTALAVAGVLVLSSCSDSRDRETELTLAQRGRPSDYVVSVSKDPTPAQRFAADELTNYVARLTGVRLAVVSEDEAVTGRRIVLSDGGKALGDDGFRLAVTNGSLCITGGRRGLLYGVYELLERFGGVHWFSSWHEIVPQLDALRVPADLSAAERPAFEMREPLWFDTHDGNFAARLRLNGNSQYLAERHGGHSHRFSRALGNCHTFAKLIPPDVYFKEHPEYFSLVGGYRDRNAQLCLTNPDVLKIVVDKVKEAIRQEPNALYFGVSQNDRKGWCECPACKAIDDEEESHAGTMIRFVNAVAAEVEKEFPDKIIETLAYEYTRKPPKKTRVRHNVMPCLCTVECDFSRPLATSPAPENRSFAADIAGWAAQTDQLYVWDYTTNFRHYLHAYPNVNVLQDNMRFFRDHHVVSLFEQGDYQGRHADFAELKTWLIAKWMWNPELPREELLDTFFAGYYGKAAPFVREYFDELYRRRLAWAGNDPERSLKILEDVFCPAYDDAFYVWADDLLKKAEEAVRGEPAVYLRNVRTTALSVAYTRFMRQSRTLWVTKDPARYGGDGATPERVRWMRALMEEEKPVAIGESASGPLFKDRCEMILASEGQPRNGDSAQTGALAFRPGNAAIVKDESAAGGKSLRIKGTHGDWCGTLPLNLIAYDPDEEYVLRVRLRVELKDNPPPDTEVFWAGVYDPVGKRGLVPDFSLKAKDAPTEWKWVDVCTLKLDDNAYFWVGAGRYDKKLSKDNPAYVQLWIDTFEVVRKTAGSQL